MNFEKKAISPVVASALLLVVAVIAIIGFQNWYTTFQSTTLIEADSGDLINSLGTQIETIQGSNLFIKSSYNNYSVNDLLINGEHCEVDDNLQKGLDKIYLADCLNSYSDKIVDILVVTDKGTLSKKIKIDSNNYLDVNSFNISSLWNVSENATSGSGNEIFFGFIKTDLDGNSYSLGYTGATSNKTLLLRKYNLNGNKIWDYMYKYNSTTSVYGAGFEIQNNELFVLATTSDGEGGGFDVLLNLDLDGNHNWNITPYNSKFGQFGSDGDMYTSYLNDAFEIEAMKISTNTYTQIWNTSFSIFLPSIIASLLDSENNVYTTGHHVGTPDDELFITKHDLNGALLWNLTYSSSTPIKVYGADLDSKDNLHILWTNTTNDFYISKYYSNGTLDKIIPYDNINSYSSGKFKIDRSNNYYLAVDRTTDFFDLIKLDSNGNLLFIKTESIYNPSITDLMIDLHYNVYVTITGFEISFPDPISHSKIFKYEQN